MARTPRLAPVPTLAADLAGTTDDARLDQAIQALRATLTTPQQHMALKAVQARLDAIQRLVADWDATHTRQARMQVACDQFDTADFTALLLIHPVRRDALRRELDAERTRVRPADETGLDRVVAVLRRTTTSAEESYDES